MRINEEVVMMMLNRTISAIEGNDHSDRHATASQTIVGLLAVGANMGSPFWNNFIAFAPLVSMVATVGLLGQSLRPVSTWSGLRPRIEELVNQQIESYLIKNLRGISVGLESNMEAFRRVWREFNNAPPNDREKQAETLRMHHNAFLTYLRTVVPQFQLEGFAVASLTDFAATASMHVVLLAEAIKHGKEWGYPESYVDGVARFEFNERTGSSTLAPAVPMKKPSSSKRTLLSRRASDKLQMQLLSGAIDKGEAEGWSPELLETWKHAYLAVSAPTRALAGRDAAILDYPTYAREIYERGRNMVVPYKREPEMKKLGNSGLDMALSLRALSEYDAIMVMNVLSFAELWPYLTGEFKVPESVMKSLDREIYSGPYGRWMDWVPWSQKRPPPVTLRGDNITSIVVRAGKSIDSYQQKAGSHWGQFYGSDRTGTPHTIDLAPDEFVERVGLKYGHKVGALNFTTNKAMYGPYGTDKHTTFKPPKYPKLPKWRSALLQNITIAIDVARAGHGLSSAYITKWERDFWSGDGGCSGIFFGFRPLWLTADTYTPVEPAKNLSGTLHECLKEMQLVVT